jgi:hypothetical protein
MPKGHNTNLQFCPDSLGIYRVVAHAVAIRKIFDALFDLSSNVESPTSSIKIKRLRGEIQDCRSITKYSVVPPFQVGIFWDERREGSPFRRWGDQTWAVGTNGCDRGIGGFEGFLRPSHGILLSELRVRV